MTTNILKVKILKYKSQDRIIPKYLTHYCQKKETFNPAQKNTKY